MSIVVGTLLVAESILDHLQALAVCERQCGVRVTHAVKLDRADACRLDDPGELPLTDVVQVQGLAEGVVFAERIDPLSGEHEPMIVVPDRLTAV